VFDPAWKEGEPNSLTRDESPAAPSCKTLEIALDDVLLRRKVVQGRIPRLVDNAPQGFSLQALLLHVDDLQQPLLPACSRRKALLIPDQGTLRVDAFGRLTEEVGPVVTIVLYVQQARRVPGDRHLRSKKGDLPLPGSADEYLRSVLRPAGPGVEQRRGGAVNDALERETFSSNGLPEGEGARIPRSCDWRRVEERDG
jgi:hypothetical protein